MTKSPEERLAILETQMAMMTDAVTRIDERTERLDQAYTRGQGAWKATMKIGGFLLLAGGAVAWLVERLPQWLRGA